MKKKTRKKLVGGVILAGLAVTGFCVYRVCTAKIKNVGNLLATEDNPDSAAIEIKAGRVYEFRKGREYIGEQNPEVPLSKEQRKAFMRDSYSLVNIDDYMLKQSNCRKARAAGDIDGVNKNRVIPDRDFMKIFTDNKDRDFEGMAPYNGGFSNSDNKVFCELPGDEGRIMLRKKFSIPKIIWTGVKSIYGYVKVVGK